jgi:DNA-binding CsgD family transcriptional regulator
MLRQQDLVGAVEACYSLAGTESEWMRGLLEAVRPSFDDGFGVVACTFALRGAGLVRLDNVVGIGNDMLVSVFSAINAGSQAGTPEQLGMIQQLTFGSGQPFSTSSERLARAPNLQGDQAMSQIPLLAENGVLDFAAMLAPEPAGTGMLVGSPLREVHRPAPGERARFTNVAAHLGAGLRLRRALAAGRGLEEAVLAPDGACLHAETPAQPRAAREALRRAAKAIDRARGRLRRRDQDEALNIWRALCAGRWSLVDHFDSDGRRFVVARQNEPDVRDPRALSPRERQVAAFVALGRSNKYVAYALGLSPSAVALHLKNAMRKLGLPSRTRLVEVFAAVGAAATPQS